MKTLNLFILAIVLTSSLHGNHLVGKFSFIKRGPTSALVYFADDHSAKVKDIYVDQIDKQFSTPIVFAPKGSTIHFKNSDKVQHNIFSNDKLKNASFDSGLTDPNIITKQIIGWENESIIRIGCQIHPKMQLWAASIDSAYCAAINLKESKEFQIMNIPDSTKKLVVWLPRYDKIEIEISGKEQSIELKRNGKVKGELNFRIASSITEENSDKDMDDLTESSKKWMQNYKSQWSLIYKELESIAHWHSIVTAYVNNEDAIEIYKHNYRLTMLEADGADPDEIEEEGGYRKYKAGTVIMKEHFDKLNPSTLQHISFMQKRDDNNWNYVEVKPDGIITHSNLKNYDTTFNKCIDCHNEVRERDYIYHTIKAE